MAEFVFRPARRRRRVTLNLTSLIDVLFLLLIFFMLTSTFRRAGQMELELPESSTSEARPLGEQHPPVELALRADGSVTLDGESVADDESLLRRLQAITARDSSARVVLSAEAEARHGDVIRLVDLIREAGFAGLGLGTELRPPRAHAGEGGE